jgi:hypothetical protein
MGGDEPFLPWKQEYGETELVAMSSFLQDEILCTTEVRTSGLPRRQMVMADWVRSRAMKAYGSDFVHLHWWFFQGYSDLEGKPFAFRSLDIYAGEIGKSLEILGRLNLRLASGSTGEWVYYYKYLVTSDWISEIIKDDFGREADSEKFRAYNGHLLYRHDQNDIQGDDDRVLIREEAGKPGLGQLDYVLRPLDKLYACPGVELFYFTPLGTG